MTSPERDEILQSVGATDLFAAFEEPLLLVRDRRVVIANRAALALLGSHIEGSDVRLAIRHPAAAPHLAGDGAEDGPMRIELMGLGELGRPWELIIAPLPDGSLVAPGTPGAATPLARPLTGEEAKALLRNGTAPAGTDPQSAQAYANYIRRLQSGMSGFTCYASLQMPR